MEIQQNEDDFDAACNSKLESLNDKSNNSGNEDPEFTSPDTKSNN